MRLFFAVNLPESVRERVAAFARGLSRGPEVLRWVKADNCHFTLKFLGEEPEERMRLAVEAARDAAARCAPFHLALAGAGGFPDSRRPRVLWLGAKSGASALANVAARLDEALALRGFSRDDRPFLAHLTLARIKSRAEEKAASRAIEAVGPEDVAAFDVSRFSLMQSVSEKGGVHYVELESFELTGA